MTHTLHRRGTREQLEQDYVFVIMGSKDINMDGTGERMKKFYEIVMRHGPTFVGGAQRGNQLTLGVKPLLEDPVDKCVGHAVFRDADAVARVIQELMAAGFDRSVAVSGLFDGIEECCRKVGLGTPHTIEYSAGIWGRTDRLPPEEYLEIMTMCGHGMVPAALVQHLAGQVKEGRLTAEAASLKLGRQCTCGVFNVARAAELVAAMAGKKG